ncbi:MAG: extracellular solute-binding protein [Vicinamibacterales bacterium]
MKPVKISYLVPAGTGDEEIAKPVIEAFEAANPGVKVDLQTRPGGADGDNLVKTKLSTGDMADVFLYNTGSLLQAIKPAQSLLPADGAWTADLDKNFVAAASVDGKLYASPWGASFGGGILYNRPIYDKLGLKVPTTWAEFMANNAKIKAAGITPVEQTFGDTWTSQIIFLGDYHNVEVKEPDFAANYSAGKVKFATDPNGLLSFQRMEQLAKAGVLNKDFASAKLNDGLTAVAKGTVAQYPMLAAAAGQIKTLVPDKIGDVGFFAIPGDDAATNGMTVWLSGGVYIPKTTKGDKLAAAQAFQAFLTTKDGCDAETKGQAPAGPYMSKPCTLPADVPQWTKDSQVYADAGKTSTALEFKSPIKGPALEQILIQVGNGTSSATKAAENYDKDVVKAREQLGLK